MRQKVLELGTKHGTTGLTHDQGAMCMEEWDIAMKKVDLRDSQVPFPT
jgi:hypothetical protein